MKMKPFIEREIQAVEEQLERLGPADPIYAGVADNLARLYKMRDLKWHHKVDPNTVVTTVGSLAGIVLILNFERLGIISSKAMIFIKRF